MTVRVKLDQSAVRSVSFGHALGHARATANAVAASSRRTVRVKSGAVRAGIRVQPRHTKTKARFLVMAAHERSMLEHEGAVPHRIVPRSRFGMLRFFWQRIGQNVVLASVNHPGTSGSKFLTGPLALHAGRAGYKVTIRSGG